MVKFDVSFVSTVAYGPEIGIQILKSLIDEYRDSFPECYTRERLSINTGDPVRQLCMDDWSHFDNFSQQQYAIKLDVDGTYYDVNKISWPRNIKIVLNQNNEFLVWIKLQSQLCL